MQDERLVQGPLARGNCGWGGNQPAEKKREEEEKERKRKKRGRGKREEEEKETKRKKLANGDSQGTELPIGPLFSFPWGQARRMCRPVEEVEYRVVDSASGRTVCRALHLAAGLEPKQWLDGS